MKFDITCQNCRNIWNENLVTALSLNFDFPILDRTRRILFLIRAIQLERVLYAQYFIIKAWIGVYYPGFLFTCLLLCIYPGGERCPMSLSPGCWPSSLRLLCLDLGEILTCRCLEPPGPPVSVTSHPWAEARQSVSGDHSDHNHLECFCKDFLVVRITDVLIQREKPPVWSISAVRPHVLPLPSLVYVRSANTRSLDMRENSPVRTFYRWLLRDINYGGIQWSESEKQGEQQSALRELRIKMQRWNVNCEAVGIYLKDRHNEDQEQIPDSSYSATQ